MQDAVTNRLRFEDFVLDVGRRMLSKSGRALELRPRSFDVLVYLAEAPGRVVGKEEILAAVWPRVVVGEESLTRCVSDIRLALGDEDHRLIKTLPRRGYLFAAPVEPIDLAREEPPGSSAPPPASPAAAEEFEAAAPAVSPGMPRAARQRWRPWAGVTAAALALVALGSAWWSSGPALPVAAPRLSIVVLPLASHAGDAAQDQLAAVLTEEITVDLSRIPESFVIARATAESYRGRGVDARQVGRELGVRYVLDGSLARLGSEVRLSLQLADAGNGLTLWAERIDGELRDLPALYRRVTGTVARALDLKLLEVESARARARPDTDLQDVLLRAKWILHYTKSPDQVQAAREMLQRATARDPASAIAWALLAQTYNYDVSHRWMVQRGATREQWLQHADGLSARAFGLDSTDPRIVGVRATALALAGRSEEALPLFERQIALNRNDADAWFWLGYARCTLGQQEPAIAALEQARRLSPRDPKLNGYFIVTAAAHLYVGRDREALAWARRSALEKPQHPVSHSWVAAAAANLGETETARAALAEFRRLLPQYTIASFRNEQLCANDLCRAQRERYYAGLAKAGLRD